jgi:hypothetical protein
MRREPAPPAVSWRDRPGPALSFRRACALRDAVAVAGTCYQAVWLARGERFAVAASPLEVAASPLPDREDPALRRACRRVNAPAAVDSPAA